MGDRSWKHKKCKKCNKEFRTQSINTTECKECRNVKAKKKECPVCKKSHYKAGKTCSQSCTNKLKSETWQKTLGAPHNFANGSSSLKKQREKLKEEGFVNNAQKPEAKEKIRATMLQRYGEWFTASKEGRKTIIESVMKKYGVPHIMQVKEFAEKLSGENHYLKNNPKGREKLSNILKEVRNSDEFKQKQIERGNWKDPNHLSEIELYYNHVWDLTQYNYEKYGKEYFGEDYEKRGKEYHLDHIFPVIKGYYYGVPPSMIGDLKNLRIITARENLKKGTKIIEIPEHILEEINSNINIRIDEDKKG